MRLSLPEEPRDIKERIKAVRARLGYSGDIDWDLLSVWSFNRLPKYLWEQWKDKLKERSIT